MIFELPVTEEKVKPHQITALHLLCAFAFIGIGVFLYWLLPFISQLGPVYLAAGTVILILALFRNKWLTSKNFNTVVRLLELGLLIRICILTAYLRTRIPFSMFGILAVVVLLALIWERSAKGNMNVRIDEKGLKLPVLSRRRNMDWRDVEQVLYRHGILTIDCVDNRLFQWTIKDADVDNDIFEAFCKHQVETNKGRRIADW